MPALDKAIEESYPVGYEVVDQVHKESRKDLKGQFIYAALLDIDRKQYIATIKLDDTAVDTRGHFKDIKIKERPLYAGQLQAVVDLPADRNVTVQQLIDYVKADFSESSLFSEEMPTVPDYNGLHFSTQIRSNCPVRTPWIISGDRKFSRESTHLYLLFKTRVSPFFIGIATLPGA